MLVFFKEALTSESPRLFVKIIHYEMNKPSV